MEKKENAFVKFGKSVKEKFQSLTKKPEEKKQMPIQTKDRNHFQEEILQSVSLEAHDSCQHEANEFLLVDKSNPIPKVLKEESTDEFEKFDATFTLQDQTQLSLPVLIDLLKKGALNPKDPLPSLIVTIVKEGIPLQVRPAMYSLMSKSQALKELFVQEQNFCYELIANNEALPDQDTIDQIQKDIQRTYPKHISEEVKQEMLRKTKRILRVYAQLDPEVGYVQGMNSIVCALLYCMHQVDEERKGLSPEQRQSLLEVRNNDTSEESVFWIFVGILHFKKKKKKT